MDKTTIVKVSVGEFTIKNELTIGQETQIAVARAQLSGGMYGQMIESPNAAEMTAAFRLYKLTELDGRIEKAPDDWKGCSEMTGEQVDELWKEWAEKSGKFPAEPADSTGTDQGGGGESSEGSEDSSG